MGRFTRFFLNVYQYEYVYRTGGTSIQRRSVLGVGRPFLDGFLHDLMAPVGATHEEPDSHLELGNDSRLFRL